MEETPESRIAFLIGIVNPTVKGLTCWLDASSPIYGALVQLVRMLACLGNSQGMSLGKGLVMLWN